MIQKMHAYDRFLLLGAGLLASYQIAVGIDDLEALEIVFYTISFGVLLIAGLLLIIYGYEAMDQPVVAIVATLVPICLSLGLMGEYLPGLFWPYLTFSSIGFLAILVTRLKSRSRLKTIVLGGVHGVAGLLICTLPIQLSLSNQAQPGFALVGIGGGLVSLAGLLLFCVRTGQPILSKEHVLSLFPLLLLLMTAAFVAGFALG